MRKSSKRQAKHPAILRCTPNVSIKETLPQALIEMFKSKHTIAENGKFSAVEFGKNSISQILTFGYFAEVP